MNIDKLRSQIFSSLLLIILTGCAAVTGRETAGEYVDDSAITASVKAVILKEPSLHVYQIHVETFKDVVQLSGFVDTYQQVLKAGEVARRVQGVRAVKNDLKVRRKK